MFGKPRNTRRSSLHRFKQFIVRLEYRWPSLSIVLAFFISGLMLLLFGELAWKTLFRHQLVFFDNMVIWLVRYFANPVLDTVMLTITFLGSAPFYGVLAVVILCGLSLYRRWLEATALTLCLAGGGGLDNLLKHIFERARPDMFHIISETGYSFPSGHAMISLCFYGMIAFLISRHLPQWSWRLSLFIATGLFVIAIGISRIYLGVHYPTDVVAGYAAGFTWLFFCISLLMVWEHKRKVQDRIPVR